jgi:hypothetical protein
VSRGGVEKHQLGGGLFAARQEPPLHFFAGVFFLVLAFYLIVNKIRNYFVIINVRSNVFIYFFGSKPAAPQQMTGGYIPGSRSRNRMGRRSKSKAY